MEHVEIIVERCRRKKDKKNTPISKNGNTNNKNKCSQDYGEFEEDEGNMEWARKIEVKTKKLSVYRKKIKKALKVTHKANIEK